MVCLGVNLVIGRARPEPCFKQASTKVSTRKNAFNNQERKLEDRRRLDTALVLTVNDPNQQLGDATTFGALSSFQETKIGFRGKNGCKVET
uniref:Uncharacterized protein n=1 Tax=Anopheles stephensi TaxID=30069 RepID=A0A182YTI3_ANOST